MDTTLILPLILGVLAVGSIAWVVLSHRHHKRRLAAMADAAVLERRQWDAYVQESAAAHLAELEGQRRATQESEALVSRYHDAFTKALKWEVGSRTTLLRMLSRHGVDGVLFSGVVFTAEGRAHERFVTQLDHVLLLDDRVVVIEAKNWKGVVFDGIDPTKIHRSWGALLGPAPDGEFAIQVGQEDQGLAIRRYPDPLGRSNKRSQAPRVQVRAQALRLRRVIEAGTGEDIGIDACVFYSHPDVLLFTPRRGGPIRTPYTPVFDSPGMDDHLGRLGNGRAQSGLIDRLAPILSTLATDATGVGSHAETWRSVLDADVSQPDG